jgi:hypothetical protein
MKTESAHPSPVEYNNLSNDFQQDLGLAGCLFRSRPILPNETAVRASRKTELTNKFPEHVVCKRVGNSKAVANKHNLQVTDEHFETATRDGANSGAIDAEGGANAVLQAAATNRTTTHQRKEPQQLASQTVSGSHTYENYPMGDTGFEPATSAV